MNETETEVETEVVYPLQWVGERESRCPGYRRVFAWRVGATYLQVGEVTGGCGRWTATVGGIPVGQFFTMKAAKRAVEAAVGELV